MMHRNISAFIFFSIFLFSINYVTASNDTLRVMTWNVKLLPRVLISIHHHPAIRAKYIPDQILKENVDVVVFQEAFDHKALHIITKKLIKAMPYTAGHVQGHALTRKSSGGVLMFSKYPFDTMAREKYVQCKSFDCIGKKGALMVELVKGGKKIQIIGTHMQAGGSKELKISQYQQMADLGKNCCKKGELQLFCGDFNTRKSDTILYPKLVQTLDVKDGDFAGELQYTSDHLLNDMEEYDPAKRRVIDYIFVKPNGMEPKSVTRYIRRFEYQWNKKHKDLSDHFAVVMDLVY